jgi:hypothetical protein
MGPAPDDAVAGKDQWPPGHLNDLNRALDLRMKRFRHQRRLHQQRTIAFGRISQAGCHILGQFQMGGARLLRLGHLERFPKSFWNNRRHRNLRLPFCHRFEHGHHIDVLMRLLMHTVER